MNKPIYEKIRIIEKEIEYIILQDDNVVDMEIEDDDIVADYDFLLTFNNKENVKQLVEDLVENIENKLSYISVDVLNEQIEDGLKEDSEFIMVDFYCNINLR